MAMKIFSVHHHMIFENMYAEEEICYQSKHEMYFLIPCLQVLIDKEPADPGAAEHQGAAGAPLGQQGGKDGGGGGPVRTRDSLQERGQPDTVCSWPHS